MDNKYPDNLPMAQWRIGEMKSDVHDSMEGVERMAWELHDQVRDVRIAIGRLFAAQSDYGDSAR